MSALDRRSLLKGLGASVCGVPLLRALLATSADAATGHAPTRFVLVFCGNGQARSQWLPTATETSFTLGEGLLPLAGLESELLLLRGFTGEATHAIAMSETTTGRPSVDGSGIPTGGPSIDQFFASRWAGDTPLASLELAVQPNDDPFDHIVYSARGLPIPPVGDPADGFDRVFDLANVDPVVAEARRAAQRSVLDSFSSEVTALQSKLDTSSRRLLDEHLTLVREQELELMAPYVPVACEPHPAPAAGLGTEATWSAHNDTMVAALRCGLTRVATLRVGGWGGLRPGAFSEIGLEFGHHDVAHGRSTDPYADLLAIHQLHSRQVADLVAKLAAVPEPSGGTLLDHTVVVWVNELGLDEFSHARSDLQVVLAGGRGLGMATGAYRELPPTAYGHFLVSLTHLLGEPVERFGDAGTLVVPELWA